MKKMRLIQPIVAIPRYRQLRMPTVAAEFAQYIDVEINDENIEKLDLSPVDIVGITCQTYNAARAFYISEQFRKHGVKTVLGGVFATTMQDEALKHFDAVVIGELEGLGKDIVDDLERGTLKKVYKNSVPPDLSKTNLPRFDLLKNNKYYRFNFPIETSRGCPHNCSFCFSSYQYPSYRTRSLDDIERDLNQWDHGVVEVIDLHFAGSRKFLFKLCDLFINMNIVTWYGEATIMSLKDEEVVKKLSQSNCRMIFVGLESISKDTLSGMNKGFNDVQQYKRIISMCQDYGIFIHSGFIWGLPGQDESVFDETFKFCQDVKLYLASSNFVTYFPGTSIFEENKKSGNILTEDFRDYDSAHITVKPETLTPEQILKGVKRFNRKYYSFKSIIRRSFQKTNSNFMLLYDYLGFSYLYRSYYRHWLKKVKQGIKELKDDLKSGSGEIKQNPEVFDNKNSIPHLYRNIPVEYSVFEWIWRYWEFWFRKVALPSTPAGIVFLIISFFLFIASLLIIYGAPPADGILNINWGEYSAVINLLISYTALFTTSCMLLHSVSGRIQKNAFAFSAGFLIFLPLIHLPFLHTDSEPLLIFLISAANTFTVMKLISFFHSDGRNSASLVRLFLFLILSPSLDFDDSFQIDFRNSTFGTALRAVSLGLLQGCLAVVIFSTLIYVDLFIKVSRNITSVPFWLIIAAKGLYVYTAMACVLNIITGTWKAWGYKMMTPFDKPLISATPEQFWKRFNCEYSRWSVKNLYLPLRKAMKLGGLMTGTLIPFVFGGVLSSYVCTAVYFSAHGVTNGNQLAEGIYSIIVYVMLFFILNGAVVLMIKYYRSRSAGPAVSEHGFVFRTAGSVLTLIFITASSAFFFMAIDKIFTK